MSTENPYRPGPPRSQVPARPSLLIQVLRPVYVAAATVVLVLLTVICDLMTWASGAGTVSGLPYIAVSVDGFGRVSSDSGDGALRAGHLLAALVILLLLAAAVVCLVATEAHRLGAVALSAAGVLGVGKGLVAVVTGEGKGDGFGLISPERFSSYFWDIDYTSSTGAGPFLAVLLGLVTLAVGLVYLVLGARGPLIPLSWRMRTSPDIRRR
ncbi:MAG: hypothetical protein L0K27_07095 [Corynebacterium nuruki]|nr:hypothetical protein [Corynebacterium nuruki]